MLVYISRSRTVVERRKVTTTCTTTTLGRKQFTEWKVPSGESTGIQVTNSLCKEKVELVLPKRNTVSWYTCGPTVYDDAHLGHARNYVSVDIIQRILKHYFGMNVVHVMGMTDIDDKIINKAKSESKSYLDIAKHYETEFLKDMKDLGVIKPVAITRVSEHIPEIISYVDRILQNGYAYKVPSGSVYFDHTKYTQYQRFLETPALPDESVDFDEKKSPLDFALWKAAKGEPFWSTPWGNGRPGWHIECSAMICSLFGSSLDVHSGGIDLKFPHHQNEIIQCSAHYNLSPTQQWANYFFHIGHVHIAGRKMSKSLKNFITIREFLKSHTPNQFRLYCLANKYHNDLEYSEDRMKDAIHLEKRFMDFLATVSAITKSESDSRKKWTQHELKLFSTYTDTMSAVEAALKDNFNTPKAMDELLSLISQTHSYINTTNDPPHELLQTVAGSIANLLSMFGVTLDKVQKGDDSSYEAIVNAMVNFRSEIRSAAQALDGSSKGKILQLCDNLRDNVLPELSIQLEDKKDGPSSWKYYAKSLWLQHRQIKEELLKVPKVDHPVVVQLPANEMFLSRTDLYSKFDDQGIPTHGVNGEPLSLSALKKLKKQWIKRKRSMERKANPTTQQHEDDQEDVEE